MNETLCRSDQVCPDLAGSRSRCTLTGILKPQGAVPSPQALILLGGVKFIAWRLRHSSLGEYQQGPRDFWSRQACLGYSPVPGPTLERPCAILARLVGYMTKSPVILSCYLSHFSTADKCCRQQINFHTETTRFVLYLHKVTTFLSCPET